MAPTNTPPPDAQAQTFYNYLLTFCSFVQMQYGLFMFPIWASYPIGGPFGTEYLFFLLCPQLLTPKSLSNSFAINDGQMYTFGSDFGSLATVVLSALAYPAPMPQPLPAAAVPSPVTPVPPPDPVGQAFTDVGEIDYTDLGSPSIPVGGTVVAAQATATHPAGTFTKQGRQTPFGNSFWWTKN